MSVRYEWHHAPSTSVEFIPNGYDVDTNEPHNPLHTEEFHVEHGVALVLSADEATVLHGTPTELRDLLTRALAALPPDA